MQTKGKTKIDDSKTASTRCQSEQVLRKAKSEWNLHEALLQHPFTELVTSHEIYREEDEESESTIRNIQEISCEPFNVMMYMEHSFGVQPLLPFKKSVV